VDGLGRRLVHCYDWSKTRCILSPLLFALVIDWITRKALTSLDVGLEWTNGKLLCDLAYADDIVLLDSSIERMLKLTEGVEDEGSKVGLC